MSLFPILFFSNPYIINNILNSWEAERKRYEELDNYEVAIVLGGFSSSTQKPRDRVHFEKGADRLLNAIELYRLGKVDKILLSGGTSRIIGEKRSEATAVLPFIVNMGVRKSDIIIEAESRNTYQNAKYSSDLLKKHAPYGRYLLITSAFHMNRASACFEKQKVVHTQFPTDYYGSEFYWSPSKLILPKANAFLHWQILIKEWVGIAAYKVAGYI
jgi:uncharacterized SAM-binding protein YcdF (DUF218 family)